MSSWSSSRMSSSSVSRATSSRFALATPQLPVAARPGHGPHGSQSPAPRALQDIKVRQAKDARLADLKERFGEQISKMPGITIEANVNTEGHLYGSVGQAEIAKGLRAKNLPVDPEMVRMEGGHIKETGLFEVPLNLGYDIETKVKVLVIAQQK